MSHSPSSAQSAEHTAAIRIAIDLAVSMGNKPLADVLEDVLESLTAASAQATGQAVDDKDYVSREQVIAWGKLAGFATSLQRERNLERLGDFAIFARRDRIATPPSSDAREAGGGVWLSAEQLADIRRAAVVIRENSYPCPDKPHSNWALAERIDALLREAGSGK